MIRFLVPLLVLCCLSGDALAGHCGPRHGSVRAALARLRVVPAAVRVTVVMPPPQAVVVPIPQPMPGPVRPGVVRPARRYWPAVPGWGFVPWAK